MTTVDRTLQLDASPSEVWAVLSDFGSIAAWAPNVDHSCLLTEQAEGVGAVRRIQSGRTTIRETVETWEPDSVLSYAISGLPSLIKSVTSTWRLTQRSGGTSVTLTNEIGVGPRPPQELVARVVARRLGATSDKMLAGLAAHLDRREKSS